MKSMKPLANLLKITAFTSVLALAATVPVQGSARGGAAGLLSKAEAPAVQAGEKTAMNCPDCKTVFVPRKIESRGLGGRMLTGQLEAQVVHLCSGCKTTWSGSGHGRAATMTARHACASCAPAR
jgi:hypothetical protein